MLRRLRRRIFGVTPADPFYDVLRGTALRLYQERQARRARRRQWVPRLIASAAVGGYVVLAAWILGR